MLINIYIIIITHKKHQTAYILNQMQGDTSTRAIRDIKEMTHLHDYVHRHTHNIQARLMNKYG